MLNLIISKLGSVRKNSILQIQGRKFESHLVHITYTEIDHEIIPMVILSFH